MDESLHQEIRGRILKIMQFYYPVEVTERTMLASLNRAGYVLLPTALPRDLAYLRDKGYLESQRRHDKILGDGWTHKITPKGIDLLERNPAVYPDNGVTPPDDWM